MSDDGYTMPSTCDVQPEDHETEDNVRPSEEGPEEVNQLQKLKKSTIMMVDDEAITTEVIQAFLEYAGYSNFVTTDQSTEAMRLVLDTQPDVVLLDLMMPEVSGFDILKAMRGDKTLTHIPVIVLTSSTDSDTKLQALELGATDFLAKPVDPSELALRLKNTLASKAYQDHLINFDALSGLPNRRMFVQHSAKALSEAACDGKSVAIFHIILDRFKYVTDTLGPGAGDALIWQASKRFEQSVSILEPGDPSSTDSLVPSLYHLGKNEFMALVPDLSSVEGADIQARRIVAATEEPFHVHGHEVFTSPSIGIALFPNDGNDVDTLIKHAGIATSHAAQAGGNAYQFYSNKINARSVERLTLENQLHRALQNNELTVFYQPKVDAFTRRVKGLEGLLRWLHPIHGIVPPDKFIPLAEETGLIIPIGEWVLIEACIQAKRWESDGLGLYNISVNVSAEQFRQPEFPTSILKALQKSGLEPGFLTLELTESVIMGNARKNIDTLCELKEIGIKLSIDDFGTGYSSLSYLKQFPLDELKIDKSFIGDFHQDTRDAAIVTAVISMAQGLGLSVVAEGVETEHQFEYLKKQSCDQIQGYFVSRPLPVPELSLFLKNSMLQLIEKTG